MKITNKLLILTTFLFSGAFALAQGEDNTLSARWYTKTLTVREGDNFNVNLFVYPREGSNVVTVSNTLIYNPKNLDFVESSFPTGWLQVPNSPYFVTDTDLGMIRRTAGYANGINEPSQYVTYTFKAKKVGKTTISIEDGFALDDQNMDIGFQTKAMTLNVIPKTTVEENLLPTFTDDTADKEKTEAVTDETYKDIFESKSINITMDTVGRTAIYEGDDYVAVVNLKQLPVTNDAGAIDITMYDEENQIVYTKSELFNPGETVKEIVIPNIAFKEGNYLLNIKTSYKNIDSEIETNKEIGVLKKTDTGIPGYIVNNFNYFIGIIGLLILILLIHIHHDHVVIRDLKRRYNKAFNRI